MSHHIWDLTTGAGLPRFVEVVASYSHFAPAGNSVIYAPISWVDPLTQPSSRAIAGKLWLGQRLDEAATSGSSGLYLFTGVTSAAGALTDVYLSAPIGAAGAGTLPTVALAVSANRFRFTITNPAQSGPLSGFVNIEYGWVAEASH